jgi:O-antigen/teichoic acid export membrane protein
MFGYFKQLAGHSAIYGFAGIAGRLVALLVIPILTRILTPQEYGYIDILTTVTGFFGMAALLGMNASVTNLYYEMENEKQRCDLITSGVLFLVVWGLLVLLLTAGLGYYFGSIVLRVEVPFLWLFLALATAYLGTIRDLFSNIFRLLLMPWTYSILAIAGMLVSYGLIIVLVIAQDWRVMGYLSGMLVGTLLVAILPVVFLRNLLRGGISWDLLKRMLAFGVPLMPTDVATWAISYFERLSILSAFTTADLGVYSVGTRIAGIVVLGTFAFRLAWAPLSLSIQNRPDAHRFYRLVDKGYKIIASLFAIGLSIAASPILLMMTPPAYHSGFRVIGFMALGVFFAGGYWVSGLGLAFAKKTVYIMISVVCSAVTAIALFQLLPLYLGVVGTALAGCIGHIIGNIAVLFFGERFHKMGLSLSFTLFAAAWSLASLFLEIQIHVWISSVAGQLILGGLLFLLSCLVLPWAAFGRQQMVHAIKWLIHRTGDRLRLQFTS